MMQRLNSSRRLSGILLPFVTPFTPEGALDEESIRLMLRSYDTSGVVGYVVSGSTGEALTLREEEKERFVSIVEEENKAKLPVFLGYCGADTAHMAERIKETNHWPIDGYLISAPLYMKPTQRGIFQHYSALIEAAGDKSILIYNIPSRTAVNIENKTIFDLARRFPTIVGVKYCGSMEQGQELLKLRDSFETDVGHAFSILSGEDGVYPTMMANGADGCISVVALAFPEMYAQVDGLIKSGQKAAADAGWGELEKYATLFFVEPNPVPVKCALQQLGKIKSSAVRLPLTELLPETEAKVVNTVKNQKPFVCCNEEELVKQCVNTR